MERLEVYSAHMGKVQQWPKVYVEGIPTNVTLLGREGIPALKAIIEDILDWPLAEGTEYRLAEAVHMRAFPTEHGRGAGTTYGLILDLGRREIDGMSVYPNFGAYHGAPGTRLRNRCVRRQYRDDNNRQAGATFTITAMPRWAEQGHLHDSELSILLAEVRGAPISASGSGQASVARCMEAEAYSNRMLFTVEAFMNEVTAAMIPVPELIYFYTHMDYQLMEVGQNKPTIVPEMILQIRLRLSRNVSPEDGEDMVQQIHRRLVIEVRDRYLPVHGW